MAARANRHTSSHSVSRFLCGHRAAVWCTTKHRKVAVCVNREVTFVCGAVPQSRVFHEVTGLPFAKGLQFVCATGLQFVCAT
eukprot:5124042-Pyramimonas_sp.AAC.2